MRTTATVKGQILIPVVLRRKYGIKKGTPIDISEEDGRIVLRPITDYIDRLYGRFKGSRLVEALEVERARDKEREDAKFARFR